MTKKVSIFLGLLLLVYESSWSAPGDVRPNVLLILVDDLKPSFAAYGDTWVHSPNLDRLAARGMRFDMAYCNQAVCAPSRNNLLIGARSTSIGVYSLGYHFRRAVPEAITLPQHFMNRGYHAAGIGKVFHIGHGNTNDKLSWSVPFHPDKVDPLETKNIASERPDLVDELAAILAHHPQAKPPQPSSRGG